MSHRLNHEKLARRAPLHALVGRRPLPHLFRRRRPVRYHDSPVLMAPCPPPPAPPCSLPAPLAHLAAPTCHRRSAPLLAPSLAPLATSPAACAVAPARLARPRFAEQQVFQRWLAARLCAVARRRLAVGRRRPLRCGWRLPQANGHRSMLNEGESGHPPDATIPLVSVCGQGAQHHASPGAA